MTLEGPTATARPDHIFDLLMQLACVAFRQKVYGGILAV